MELMKAMPAAIAAPDSMAEGIAQNVDTTDMTDIVPTESINIVTTGWSENMPARTKAPAPLQAAIAICQRLSP